MRKLILLVIAHLAITNMLNAQQISGHIKDGQGSPVAGSTITLLKSSDSSIVKLGISVENGAFSFSNIRNGKYRIKATHIGYLPIGSASFDLTGDSVKIPDLLLNKESGNLKNITVTAQRPIVEVKADKTILNVEGTINAVGTDALELLRKSPGVTVDKDDNLSLSGKNGVQVYIDNRPTPLSGQDLANYLKSLQSSQIESIEIISNPSAKYDAAGNAGIINIRLKKNKAFGTNGSVNAGWNIATYAKYNAGISLNYRNKNINIFGNYSYNKGINENHLSIYRSLLDSIFDNHGVMRFNNQSQNYKAGIDYSVNKTSTIGIIIDGTISNPTLSNYSSTPISYAPTNTVNRILVADNKSILKRNNTNLNLNYSYNEKDGRSLTVNADHGTYDINSDQFQPNYYFDPSGQNELSRVVYQMVAPTTININSLKADWEQNFQKGKLGFGGKTAFVNADNDFQRYNVFTNGKDLDKDRSNHFL
ncbi:MAG TPA: outer membrane beta-barrel protein, partial [Flavisolibacter sp.]|nr:outer membrane beta-barrel protein [Flavisolibacter sp.]